jgi:hypothetical protein
MRRLALGLLALALGSAPAAPAPQSRPPQADVVVRLLADLEAAIGANRPEDLEALTAASLDRAQLASLQQTLARGAIVSATVRERARRPIPNGFDVLADILVSYGRTGRIATWDLSVRQKTDAPDRCEITRFQEIANLGGLLQLGLDTTKAFTIHNLIVQAPDFTLRMASGSAYVAEAPSGVTALVLVGKGDVRFAPPDVAEQGQLRIFDGNPSLTESIDTAFIRLNADEFASRVSEHGLVPVKGALPNLSRAQSVFDEMSPKSFNIDLGDFTDEHWSIEPSAGSLIVEFHTRHYNWLTYARSPSDPEDVSLFDRARVRNISSYASAERLATRGRFYSEDDDTAYDVERYVVDLAFDPARSWISGHASMRLRIKKDAVSSLTFKLAQPLTVSSVSSPNFGRLLALRIAGQNNVLISLPSVVTRDTDLVFDVAYSGRLEPQPIDREALVVGGQQTLPQDPSSITPIIDPEKRYIYSNRSLWYPQAPVTDYATASLRLTVPSQYQVVASGSVTSAKTTELRDTGRGESRSVRTVEYAVDRPARYLSCVISRFVEVARQRVDVPSVAGPAQNGRAGGEAADQAAVNVEVVSTPLIASRNRSLVGRVTDIVDRYAKIVGEAPYPDFTLAVLEDNLPGGHSPPYFAMVLQPLPTSPYSWGNDPVSFDSTYPQFLLAHEVAHQWWGQAIGWKNYHEQWLSEGLAQYFAVLYAGTDRGADTMRSLLVQMERSAMQYGAQGPISLGYRLGHIQGEGRIFRAIEYNKSAVVLHMLRRLMGDEAFFKGLRGFYARWRFQKAGTDDFRQAMQAQTSIKLARFFDRWIYGSTVPRVSVSVHVDETGRTAVVRIEQQGEAFDFPYTVIVQYTDGRVEDVTIPVTEATVAQTIPLTGTVKKIITKDDLTLLAYAK